MKKCLWCLKDESETSFNLEAHILPQKLGSKELCENECDVCNQYFGKRESPRKPSIDIALKETFILSKYQEVGTLLSTQIKFGKKYTKETFGLNITKNIIQTLNRDTEFFKLEISEKKRKVKTKRAFKYHQINPAILTNLIKRGIMKIGIEKAHNTKQLLHKYGGFYSEFYNYIREYVRLNKGNPKIYYLQRKVGMTLATQEISTKPSVQLYELEENYLRFEILSHNFAFSLGKSNLTEEIFLSKYIRDPLFRPIEIKSFLDIDIFYRIFNK